MINEYVRIMFALPPKTDAAEAIVMSAKSQFQTSFPRRERWPLASHIGQVSQSANREASLILD
jgi:hypothetical protein